MTVLVTEAAGFVGSSVVRQLLASNVEVAALVRPGHPRPRLDGLEKKIQMLEADTADTAATAKQLARCAPEAWHPRRLVRRARQVPPLPAQPRLAALEPLAAGGARQRPAAAILWASARASSTRWHRHRSGRIRPPGRSPFMPPASWPACLSPRPFYVYGPYEGERRLMPLAIKALSAGKEFSTAPGEMVRDYLHIDDVASGLVALSRHRLTGAFNVCSGEPVTIAGLMQTLGELLGRPEMIRLAAFPPRDWDPMYVCGDNQRLRTGAGWSPRYTLRDGLANTVEWWKGAR